MAAIYFRVNGLPGVKHTPETKKIFEKHIRDDQTISDFLRKCIISYAEAQGFEYNKHGDSLYLTAFQWLLMQADPDVPKASIMRRCILSVNGDVA